jgi:hypothetical protein
MYVVAIKDTRAWEGDSPADLSMIGFWNLVVVWLKVRLICCCAAGGRPGSTPLARFGVCRGDRGRIERPVER